MKNFLIIIFWLILFQGNGQLVTSVAIDPALITGNSKSGRVMKDIKISTTWQVFKGQEKRRGYGEFGLMTEQSPELRYHAYGIVLGAVYDVYKIEVNYHLDLQALYRPDHEIKWRYMPSNNIGLRYPLTHWLWLNYEAQFQFRPDIEIWVFSTFVGLNFKLFKTKKQ